MKTNVIQLRSLPEPEPLSSRMILHEGDLVIYQRENSKKGTWHYQLKLPGGSAVERKTTGKTNYADAQKIAEQAYQEVQYKFTKGLSVKKRLFSEVAALWIADQRRAVRLQKKVKTPHLDKCEEMINKYLIPYFGNTAVQDFTLKNVRDFHAQYQQNYHNAAQKKITVLRTKNNQGVAYREPKEIKISGGFRRKPSLNTVALFNQLILRILNFAAAENIITAAEIPAIKSPDRKLVRRGFFSEQEVVLLLEHLSNRIEKTPNPRFQEARRMLLHTVEFYIATGLRPGIEGNTLRVSDVECKFDGNKAYYEVHVRDGKRGPRNVICSYGSLNPILERIKAANPNLKRDSFLFEQTNGKVVSGLNYTLNDVLKELGFERDLNGNERSAYSLRHTYITRMIISGIPIAHIATNCGTSTEMINNYYSHVISRDVRHSFI